jgi:hypothetical protein
MKISIGNDDDIYDVEVIFVETEEGRTFVIQEMDGDLELTDITEDMKAERRSNFTVIQGGKDE